MYGKESHSYQKEKSSFRGSESFMSVHFEWPVKKYKKFSGVGGTFIYPHVFYILS